MADTLRLGSGENMVTFDPAGAILESNMTAVSSALSVPSVSPVPSVPAVLIVPTVRLSKYHGLGNDFLVMVVADGADAPDDVAHAALAIAACDRHRGIGGDGLLLCAPSSDPDADLVMKLRNADGSLAEMSGNGIRCFVHAALDAGIASPGEVRVATDAGLRMVVLGAPDTAGVVQVEVAFVSFDESERQSELTSSPQ